MFKKKQRADTVVGLDLDPSHIAAAEVHVNGSHHRHARRRRAAAPRRPARRRGRRRAGARRGAEGALRRARPAHARAPRASPTSASSCARSTCRRSTTPRRSPPPSRSRRPTTSRCRWTRRPRLPVARPVVNAARPRARASSSSPSAARWSSGSSAPPARPACRSRASTCPPSRWSARWRRPPPSGAVLYVNVAGLTNVAVANEQRLPVHPRRRRRPGRDGPHARRAPRADARARPPVARSTSACTRRSRSVEGDAELVAAARAVLEEGVHQLADTVRNSLNFYRMQESAEHGRARRRSPAPPSRSPASSSGSPSSCGCRSSPRVVAVDDERRSTRPPHGRRRPGRRRRV